MRKSPTKYALIGWVTEISWVSEKNESAVQSCSQAHHLVLLFLFLQQIRSFYLSGIQHEFQ